MLGGENAIKFYRTSTIKYLLGFKNRKINNGSLWIKKSFLGLSFLDYVFYCCW